MISFAFRGGLVLAVAVLLFGCGDPLRGPRPTGGDSSVTIDGSTDGGGGGDATVSDSTVGTDTAPPVDSSTTGDGSTTSGQCDPSCLDTPGAVCCLTCGSCGEVNCTPVCPSGLDWDCELGCCFDRSAFTCAGD